MKFEVTWYELDRQQSMVVTREIENEKECGITDVNMSDLVAFAKNDLWARYSPEIRISAEEFAIINTREEQIYKGDNDI